MKASSVVKLSLRKDTLRALFQVNDSEITRATHDSAAKVLKGAGREVTLTVQYRPEEYNR